MKELSIEEKAKRYDEAIERAKEMIKDMTNIGGVAKVDYIQYLFPELKESEDERIKKEIIKYFKKYPALSLGDYNVQDILAWLEKQGEHANFFNKIQIGDKVTRNRDGVLVNLSQLNRVAKPAERQGENSIGISEFLEKQGEQKPAWSEEQHEKESLSDIENRIINFAMQFHDNRMKPEAEWEDELKMLRDNIKIDHWSEEDETVLNNLIYALANDRVGNSRDEYVNWLKSFKERYTWKPSDEQMKALRLLNLISGISYAGQKQELIDLYNDLKKLKGE